MNKPDRITAKELKARIDRGEHPFLLDVREPKEHEYSNIGGKLIPLDELALRITELNPEQEIIVYCHHGIRSGHAAQFLRKSGFADVKNLTGGIDAYSVDADPSVKRY